MGESGGPAGRGRQGSFLVTSGGMFLFSAALLVWRAQVASSAGGSDNQFTRVFFAGWAAIFTSVLLDRLAPDDRWSATVRTILVATNFVLVAVGSYVVADAFWP